MTRPDFTGVPASAVADVLRVGGLPHRALSHRIKGLAPGRSLAGPAFCARGEAALGGPEPANVRAVRYEMFRRFVPGAILVIGTGGYDECAVLGENVAVAVRARGCSGIVLDGGVRDRDALGAMDIPVYARFSTPVSSAGKWRYVELEQALHMPGQTTASVIVNPGDWLVGDGDGIMVVPGEHAHDVAEDARRLLAVEEGQRPRLASGEDPEAVYKGADRYGHVRRLVAVDAR